MSDEKVLIALAENEIGMVVGALDAYEYWELGDRLPRNNGVVFIPGDFLGESDRYWSEGHTITAAEAEAIEQVRACRALADRLRSHDVPVASPTVT